MTDKEILQKVIEKVERNEFDLCNFLKVGSMSSLDYDYYLEELIKSKAYYIIIFSREFAKAFWKKKKIKICSRCNGQGYYYPEAYATLTDAITKRYCSYCNCTGKIKNINSWKNHQHRMLDWVQAGKNPLKFLEKFL